VIQRIDTLKEKFKGVKVLLGVDRLDYIKGVPQKLHAFELFLTKHPEWNEKVMLIQIAVPSREDVEEYQHLRQVVNELVGDINGHYGTVEFTPIHFIHKSVDFEELVALYAISDGCVVSSTRDGMNLVSYEYIASQGEKHGALVLSEFAGAAQSLNGSIIVNPWNTEELAEAIHEAVTMPESVKAANHEKLSKYVNKHTAAFWGNSFVKELQRISSIETRQVPKLPIDKVLLEMKKSQKKKLIFLDYDGTLTSVQQLPEFAKPSLEILNLLKKLSNIENLYVYIFSGRPREYLDKWFGEIDVGLCAEHGCFYKHPIKVPQSIPVAQREGDMLTMVAGTASSSSSSIATEKDMIPRHLDTNRWFTLVNQVDFSWQNTIQELLQHYTERTPGSFIEQKEINITWHYLNADPEFGIWQATELHVNLEKILSHSPVSVLFFN
jgi:trehalose-6-phosphatase